MKKTLDGRLANQAPAELSGLMNLGNSSRETITAKSAYAAGSARIHSTHALVAAIAAVVFSSSDGLLAARGREPAPPLAKMRRITSIWPSWTGLKSDR